MDEMIKAGTTVPYPFLSRSGRPARFLRRRGPITNPHLRLVDERPPAEPTNGPQLRLLDDLPVRAPGGCAIADAALGPRQPTQG